MISADQLVATRSLTRLVTSVLAAFKKNDLSSSKRIAYSHICTCVSFLYTLDKTSLYLLGSRVFFVLTQLMFASFSAVWKQTRNSCARARKYNKGNYPNKPLKQPFVTRGEIFKKLFVLWLISWKSVMTERTIIRNAKRSTFHPISQISYTLL